MIWTRRNEQWFKQEKGEGAKGFEEPVKKKKIDEGEEEEEAYEGEKGKGSGWQQELEKEPQYRRWENYSSTAMWRLQQCTSAKTTTAQFCKNWFTCASGTGQAPQPILPPSLSGLSYHPWYLFASYGLSHHP